MWGSIVGAILGALAGGVTGYATASIRINRTSAGRDATQGENTIGNTVTAYGAGSNAAGRDSWRT
jgi:hypothetical protein